MKVAGWVLSDTPMKIHHNVPVGRDGIGHQTENVELRPAAIRGRELIG
jgi:hypothetical protein